MLDLNKKNDLSAEIKFLVNDIENTGKTIDLYCELIVQMFMKQSTNN